MSKWIKSDISRVLSNGDTAFVWHCEKCDTPIYYNEYEWENDEWVKAPDVFEQECEVCERKAKLAQELQHKG